MSQARLGQAGPGSRLPHGSGLLCPRACCSRPSCWAPVRSYLASGSQPVEVPVLSSHETPFLPPTLAPAAPAAAAQAQSPAKAQPTQAQVCSDNLTFMDDLSIKDGTVFAPGAQLDKRWKVENSGTCNWNQHYRMKLIAGSELGVAVRAGSLSGAQRVSGSHPHRLYCAGCPGQLPQRLAGLQPQGRSLRRPVLYRHRRRSPHGGSLKRTKIKTRAGVLPRPRF